MSSHTHTHTSVSYHLGTNCCDERSYAKGRSACKVVAPKQSEWVEQETHNNAERVSSLGPF